ncbi:FAD-dependent monooxygenase [Deinococcus misasensis]|uniref:FAD-dependent monooxygenase n=1 Tax=Deinococcus misasensis TaxID=392413 RepID=UPI0005502F71|nr:FAD-dependent monooxygenase [Deinococcus misasensis]
MRILIAGAGIAGLVLGQALKKLAPEVEFTITEKSPSLQTAGAGLILAPNALQVLEQLDALDRLLPLGQNLGASHLCDARGKSLQALRAPAGKLLAFHRGELSAQLAKGLEPHLKFGQAYQSHQPKNGKLEVQFTDGSVVQADVLIGADGLHSRVRQQVHGPSVVHAGYTSWRAVLPFSQKLEGARELWGHGKRLGLVPLTENRLYVYLTLNSKAQQFQRSRPAFSSLFAEFSGADFGALNLLDQHPVIHTDIRELPVPFWGNGQVVLLGDAAHALTPNLGQGAGMGIEDALWLAKGIQSGQKNLSVWMRQGRQKRVQQVQILSRHLGRAGQLQNRGLVSIRNALLGAVPGQPPTWLWNPDQSLK